jgi:hypothetical protein
MKIIAVIDTTHNGMNNIKVNVTRHTIKVQRNIEARSCNHCCCGKAVTVTYSECVTVALVIQHAKRMHHVIFSSVASLVLQHFSTLSHKRHDFRKKSY